MPRLFFSLLTGIGLLMSSCDAPVRRVGPPGTALARQAEDHKVIRITPEDLLAAARAAGDSLVHLVAAAPDSLPLAPGRFGLTRFPAAAPLARSLGAHLEIRAAAMTEAHVSRPTAEEFVYEAPAGAAAAWYIRLPRAGVAEFFIQLHRKPTRAEKRAKR